MAQGGGLVREILCPEKCSSGKIPPQSLKVTGKTALHFSTVKGKAQGRLSGPPFLGRWKGYHIHHCHKSVPTDTDIHVRLQNRRQLRSAVSWAVHLQQQPPHPVITVKQRVLSLNLVCR